ncbi:uncharacterized protein LOC135498554 [Lineus longissimus]|uniref:uncharacterized protein LOC135498554 n=1 Tax=Lineus longissimus TaxID=88925 RepID=UPI00315C7149
MMASNTTKVINVCPVCLDSKPLKIVGRCKHCFCTECILITLGSHEGDEFPCPTCKVECPRPWDGVKGMVDFTGEDVAVVDTVVKIGRKGGSGEKELQPMGRGKGRGKAGAETERPPNKRRGLGNGEKRDGNKAGITMDVKCTICHHKKKEVQAVNLCVECGNLHICEECTKVHARNKATQGHVVVRFRSETKQQDVMCEKHDSSLNSFCHDCGTAACMVCVMLDHGEHTVEKLVDVVDKKVAEMKVTLEKKQEKLEEFKNLKKDLALLKLIVPEVDKQDILIKEIEDHAQKCIEQITKWKEGLKEQVKVDYKVVKDIPVGFEKLSEMVEELQAPTERAGRLLTETEYDPEYLYKLTALKQEMDAMVDGEGDIEEKGYRKQLRVLHRKHHTFFPKEIPLSFGRSDCADEEEEEEEDEEYLYGYDSTEIFKKTMQVSSEDMFIPCVANLGQMFAVAHPTRLGEPSLAIDIYKLPGTLKRTFKDHVPPLYDMSSTPDGKLAVLSNGTGGTGCSVKLFDPDAGYISSTRDIDITEPLSLGVTLQHQYVILGGNKEGQKVITVVDKSGVVEHTHKMYKDSKGESDAASTVAVHIPKRITCGGRFVFVTGDDYTAAYEITDTEIHVHKTVVVNQKVKYIDISATIWDDFFLFFVNFDKVWMSMHKLDTDDVSKSEWYPRGWSIICDLEPGDERPIRFSAGDTHFVMSHGQTIRVYKIQQRLLKI